MSWGNEVDIAKLNNYFYQTAGSIPKHFGEDEYYLSLTCEQHFLTAYKKCPPLKSIVGKRAKTFNTGIVQILNKRTDSEANGQKVIKDLLARPNAIQSGSQFFAQQNIYIDIFGYCPVLVVRRNSFARDSPDSISAIWNIPPWLFDLEYTRKWLNQRDVSGIISDYFMYWNGEKITLNAKDISFIFDDFSIGTETDSNLIIPDSRLIGNEYPISNIIAAYKSRNTLITKRGAIGILSNESTDADGTKKLMPGEREEVQNSFKKYGLVGQAYQIIITESNLKWQQIGFPTKELLLFEEVEEDIGRLCEAYQYPAGLMYTNKKSTFNNQNQDRKELYEGIVPESDSRMEQFSRIILPENFLIWRDYSHLMVFQEDTKLKAEARLAVDNACEKEYKNGLITKNDWLERLGEDTIEDPEFEKYYEEPKSNDKGKA